MDQNDKIANDKIAKLESEIKVLKNEVQAVLLDLRESYLNVQNPFNSAPNPTAVQPIVINQQAPVQESRPEPQPRENPKIEPLRLEKDFPVESPPNEGHEPEKVVDHFKTKPDVHAKIESRPVKSPEPEIKKSARLELVVMAGLMGWVEESTKKLGRERTEAILDISEAMGHIPGNLRPILGKLIALAPQIPIDNPLRTRDYLDSLIKINSLLCKDNSEETAILLLSLLSGDQNHG